MDEQDFEPIQGPPISQEWLNQKRERLQREADYNARQNDRAETQGWFADLKASIDAETAVWAGLPCGGEMERAVDCSDEFAATCERKLHIMCARRQYAEAQREEKAWHAGKARAAQQKGVPNHLIKIVWESEPQETEARKLLEAAFKAEKKPTIVVLSGGVGCGKSCASARWAVEKSAKFVTANELARVSPYEEGAVDLSKATHLVIDDLGCEYLDPKGFFLSNLDGLINDRYSNDRPTVITTNLDEEGFRRYGERVLDRIRESGRFLKVGGKSMRRK